MAASGWLDPGVAAPALAPALPGAYDGIVPVFCPTCQLRDRAERHPASFENHLIDQGTFYCAWGCFRHPGTRLEKKEREPVTPPAHALADPEQIGLVHDGEMLSSSHRRTAGRRRDARSTPDVAVVISGPMPSTGRTTICVAISFRKRRLIVAHTMHASMRLWKQPQA